MQLDTVHNSNMMTKDELFEIFSPTEEIKELQFDLSNGMVKFFYDPDSDSPPRVIIGGEPLSLTQESYLNACKIIGLGSSYVERTPVDLIMPHLNYWFTTLGGQRKALIREGKVVAFMRSGTEVYSNQKLIDSIVSVFESLGHKNILFDKVYHDLYETQVSIVLDSFSSELPTGEVVYGGLQIQNSVLGLKPLLISAYVSHSVSDLAGGMISVTTNGQWDRRLGSTADEIAEFMEKDLNLNTDEIYTAYKWAEQASRDVNIRLIREFESVKRLSSIPVGSHAGTFFADIFKKYKIPVALRKAVQEEYADRGGNTVLDLWASMVAVSGRPEVRGNASSTRHMMTVAGEIAAHPDRCQECHRLMDVVQ